jgi:hypothetical protein
MAAVHAFGTTFTWNGVVIANLTAINGIELSVDSIDVTSHQSADYYKQVLPGLIDAGEVSIEGNFEYTDTTGQVAMMTDLNNRTSRTGIITFPSATGSTWTFTGYVLGLKIGDAGLDGTVPFSAKIKPTGKPTFATTASNNLSALSFTTATLYPAFAAGTYLYTATTTGATFTVTSTFAAGTCTVAANSTSQTVLTTVASSAISAGVANTVTPVTITVAEANKAPKVYSVYVTKTA